MDKKRLLSIIIGVVVVIVIIIVGFIIFGGKTQTPAAITPQGTGGTLPQTGNQSVGGNTGTGMGVSNPTSTTGTSPSGSASTFGIISSENVLDYFVDAKGNVFVVEPDGKIAAITNNQATFLSSSEVQNLITASFSNDGKKVLVNFGDPANPQSSVFDVASKAWAPLPTGIVSPAWSPSDYRIAYLQTNKSGSVSISTIDGSRPKNGPVALLTLNIQDMALSWPSKNLMVLHDKPSVYAQGSAWFFTPSTQSLTPVSLENFGLESTWSSATSEIGLAFTSGTGGRGGQLLQVNPLTGTSGGLNFLTLPSKCTFSNYAASSTAAYLAAYCAVPNDPGELANRILPDDYNQFAVFTTDDFYRLHTDTGASELVFAPNGSYDATDLRVFNNTLFFVNRYDSKLYAILLTTGS